MSTEPEGQWAEAMERVRAVDPRNSRPSWNRLAEMAGVSTTTLTMMVTGRRRASMATIRKVAEALRLDADTVAAWVGGGSVTPYQVPEEVHLLTPRQQKALTELIRAIAEEQTGGEHGGDTAATNEPGTVVRYPGRVAAGLVEAWEEWPVERRREALRGLISRVVVTPGEAGPEVAVVESWAG